MPVVVVDGIEVEIGEHERLNGIQAAARAGVKIPHYCWHPGLTVVASCRMCLVESGRQDPKTGQVQMQPKVVPACQTPATPGTIFVTDSQKVRDARAMVEEDLLLRHPIDCPICDKAGECSLQDYHFLHGRKERRADIRPFTSRRRDLGETVTLFVDRCVMCTRCVRFTREVAGTAELMVAHRGSHEEIDVFPGFPLANKLSGCVVDLCPVGALGDQDFLYQQRIWFMQEHDQVCAGCATGCSIRVSENQDRVYRLKPRENPHVNQYWMCDEGRYGWKHVHDPGRLTDPKVVREGVPVPLDWSVAGKELQNRLGGRRCGLVLSPHLTVEDAYLLIKYVRSLDAQATLALGPVPREGEDEVFPGGFTIRAEKCPNRRGIAELLRHFTGAIVPWEEFLAQLPESGLQAVWVAGGYKNDWHDAETVAAFAGLETLVVQDCFDFPLVRAAHLQFPAATFAEREGSYVNANDRLQSFRWAVRPPAGVLTEGLLAWRLLGRPGLFRAATVLAELAGEVPFFAAASGGVPEHGVDLTTAQPALSGTGA